MEFSGSAFLPGAREKRKGSLEGKPPNFGEPLLPRFALLTDDLLIVNVPSLTEGVADKNAEWPPGNIRVNYIFCPAGAAGCATTVSETRVV
jgi:hypothetical protein